jgi:hypothetical protein
MINMNTNAHLNLLGRKCTREFENTFKNSMEMCFSDQLDEVLKGKKIMFSLGRDPRPVSPIQGWRRCYQDGFIDPRVIHPSEKSTIVAAVDSSAIHLADTEDGLLFSIKSGIVISSRKQILLHIILGPILLYLTKDSVYSSNLDNNLANLILMDSNSAKRLIRIRLERALQLDISRLFNDSILLVDGSLSPSVFENNDNTINRVIEVSSLNRNHIIGLCKNTRIRIFNQLETVLRHIPEPACVDVDYLAEGLSRTKSGKNMLVKLGSHENDYVLRAEICSATDNNLECLEELIGNDIIFRSYPEALRIAHHVSTFTDTEISSLKEHVLRSYGVVEIDRTITRQDLLGVTPK